MRHMPKLKRYQQPHRKLAGNGGDGGGIGRPRNMLTSTTSGQRGNFPIRKKGGDMVLNRTIHCMGDTSESGDGTVFNAEREA